MVFTRKIARTLLVGGVAGLGFLSFNVQAQDQGIRVVTSIKPIHSLVSGVLAGVGEADLILDGASSPHTYSLKPSQARSLQDAEVIFWVGDELEVFLEKPLETLGQDARIVSLADTAGLTKLEFREGGAFDAHGDHDDHGDHDGHEDHAEAHDAHADHEKHDEHEKHDDHDGHEDHAEAHDAHADHEKHDEHEKHDDHEGHEDHAEAHDAHADHEKHDEHEKHDDHDRHEDHAEAHDAHADHEKHDEHEKHDDHDGDGDHAEHEDHDDAHHAGHEGHDGFDPHVWLDPVNAALLVTHIAEVLSEADPDNAQRYDANATAMLKDLEQLRSDVATQLEPVRDQPFVVFHDAYHYFENRFGLEAAGSLTINPESMPGAARLDEIRQKLKTLEAACVFSEPQFQTRIIDVAREGTNAGAGVLDPLGATLENGPALYGQLIRNMATSFRDCLSESS